MANKKIQKKRLRKFESVIRKYKSKIDELNDEIEKYKRRATFAG